MENYRFKDLVEVIGASKKGLTLTPSPSFRSWTPNVYPLASSSVRHVRLRLVCQVRKRKR